MLFADTVGHISIGRLITTFQIRASNGWGFTTQNMKADWGRSIVSYMYIYYAPEAATFQTLPASPFCTSP